MCSGLRHRLPTGCAALRWGQKRPAGVISGLRQRLPTSCGVLRWAGVKATCRVVLRPDVPSADRLRRSTMGRGKSHLPGCAPACGIWRRAAAFYDGQGQKPPAGVRSGQTCRLPTGCGVLRGQGQKRRAGVISGLPRHLATSCAALRWAGVKAACRGVLRPAAASTDKLRRPTTGRSKSGLPGCAPVCCGICRRAAASYDGQE